MAAARDRSAKCGDSPKPASYDAAINSPLFPGHPSVTAEVWEQVLDLLRDGCGLKRICREHPEFPNRVTILRAIAGGTDEQRNIYARACEDGADAMIDDAMEIADDASRDTITRTGRDGTEYDVADNEWIQRSKLRVEQRRWHAGKLKPKKYGDRVAHTGEDGGPLFFRIERHIVKPTT